MRGHETIIRMRREERRAPSFVFVNDYDCDTDWFEQGGDFARVCIAGDDLERLDFRFLVGMKVSISALSEERAKRMFELAKEAGAVLVASCHVRDDQHYLKQTGWCAVFDSATEVAHG